MNINVTPKKILLWNKRIKDLREAIEGAEQNLREAKEGNFKTIQESGAAILRAEEEISLKKGSYLINSETVREEIVEYVRRGRNSLTEEEFMKLCQIYSDSFEYLPLEGTSSYYHNLELFNPYLEEWYEIRKRREEEGLPKVLEITGEQEELSRSKTFYTLKSAKAWNRNHKNNQGKIYSDKAGTIFWVEFFEDKEEKDNSIFKCAGCAKEKSKKEMKKPKKGMCLCGDCFKLYESGLSCYEIARKLSWNCEVKEEPKEELKESSRVEEIEEVREIIEEEKKEDKEEEKETPKEEKNKKLSKTAKAKIKREKRKIRKIQEKEKELRKLEREEKRLLKEQEKVNKKLEKVRKAKLALLAKLKKAPEGSEGGETEGNEGKRGEEEKEEFKGFSKTSRIKEAKEQIKEEDKEEWKKAKSKIAARRRALTEQGFKRILRDIANSKGEPKKVKSAIKKSKRYLERIEIFEDLIRSTGKFASWAPAWFINKSKVVSKLKTLVTEWLEKNQDKEEDKKEEKETPKVKVIGGSEGSEGGENREGGETEGRGGEEGDKEEPKEELKESSRVEEIEEVREIIEEEKKEDKEEEKETPKEEPKKQEGTTLRDWQKLKEEIGIKKRYIINTSEIGWIAGRAEYKTKNIKGDLIENYKKMKKGLELIKKFEDLIETSRRFKDKQPWSVRWLRNKSPLVWKIQKFVNRWLEENKQNLIEKFAFLENVPEEYREEAKKYRAERDYWEKKSKEFWAKRTAELTAERERRRKEKKEEEE